MTVWEQIAERMREIKMRPQVEHWKVITASPLRLERIGGNGTLEEGDADFIISGSVRTWDAATPLVPGDVLCLVHAHEEWIAIDVLPDG